eukprot:15347912-Heterocapsa_arctica.AAC.2
MLSPSTARRLPPKPRSYAEPFQPLLFDFIDLSQNSMVVIPLSISQTWKLKKQVTRIPRKAASVSPKRRKNIVMKDVSLSTEVFTDSSIVHVMKWQSMVV